MRVSRTGRINPSLLFISLTYVGSWTCWFAARHTAGSGFYFKLGGLWRGISFETALILLGNCLPGVFGILILIWLRPRNELSSLLRSLNPLRTSGRALVFSIVAPVLMLFAAALLNLIRGGSAIQFPTLTFWLASVFLTIPFAPLWEEIGWRGFLLYRLKLFRTSFRASLLVGLVWGPWHAPLQGMVYQQLPNVNAFFGFLLFCLSVMGLSVILTWLYNRADGALLPCIIFHAVYNNTSSYFIGFALRADGLKPLIWMDVAIWTVAIYLRLRFGSELGVRKMSTDETLPLSPSSTGPRGQF